MGTGGCQCGRVRYEITAEPLGLYVCHCRECQRQSGSAFGMSMPVSREAVHLLRGTLTAWHRTADSGREVTCYFCAQCGTRLFHAPSRDPDLWNLKPGTLDDTSRLRPQGHVWTSRAQAWVSIPDDDDRTCAGQPSDPVGFVRTAKDA